MQQSERAERSLNNVKRLSMHGHFNTMIGNLIEPTLMSGSNIENIKG